jgi:hypothetical protein
MEDRMTTITATANYQHRRFTIRKYDEKGNCFAKYRTHRMTKEEFYENEFNTEEDWRQYLKTGSYIAYTGKLS